MLPWMPSVISIRMLGLRSLTVPLLRKPAIASMLHTSKREMMENQLIEYFLAEHTDLEDLPQLMDVVEHVVGLDNEQLLQTFAYIFGDRDS